MPVSIKNYQNTRMIGLNKLVRIKQRDDVRADGEPYTLNVLSSTDRFDTPKDWSDLENWINQHDLFEDRKKLMTAACMAWNLSKVK